VIGGFEAENCQVGAVETKQRKVALCEVDIELSHVRAMLLKPIPAGSITSLPMVECDFHTAIDERDKGVVPRAADPCAGNKIWFPQVLCDKRGELGNIKDLDGSEVRHCEWAVRRWRDER